MSEILRLEDIRRHYVQGGEALEVLRGVNLSVRAGEVVALVGPSGSGKTTLLQIAGLLDVPSAGSITIAGENVTAVGDARRTQARRGQIGFVYQFHHLLPEFSALENIVLPQMIAGVSRGAAAEKARGLLAEMGLSARAAHRPGKLSGGEQQRVAIARALANAPKLLLADEPTGNLDPHIAGEVFAHLLEQARRHRLAALIATHNMELARRMDRILTLREGRLE